MNEDQLRSVVNSLIADNTRDLRENVQHLNDMLTDFHRRAVFTGGLSVSANLLPSQRTALEALQNIDWSMQNDPRLALLVVHTGCGKSGIIASGMFALQPSPRRVLVIAPDTTIRDQLRVAMDHTAPDTTFLRRFNVIPRNRSLPRLFRPLSVDYRDMDQSHVVVLNIHRLREVQDFPPDFFDLVFVDEAHHWPARVCLAPIYFVLC